MCEAELIFELLISFQSLYDELLDDLKYVVTMIASV